MKRKLFGTDGVRGEANIYPMTCEIATALGRAVTHFFQSNSPQNKKPLIIVGKDTRLSCYMFEQAFSAGVCSQGGEVILTGPLPTPGVAFVVKSMRAEAGVMISASHNNFSDNGIKIFDRKGLKLPDAVELAIENLVLNQTLMPIKKGAQLGNAKRLKEVFGRYLVYTKSAFPNEYDLEGKRMVIDCANGAGYKIAPMMFQELGAEVFPMAVNPNGININNKCGSTAPSEAQKEVVKYRADLGLCLDGDGDRATFIDNKGNVVEGDKVIALFAKLMLDKGEIKKGDTVVGTVMSNLGLEHYLKSLGLKFHRTNVGDRYILEYMLENNCVLGGEPSGHIILASHSTTGDGCLAGLKMMECIEYYKSNVYDLVKNITLFPQIIKNATVTKKVPMDTVAPIQEVLNNVNKKLAGDGRVLLRYSGTEPLARVMIEGKDHDLINELCDELVNVVSTELK